MKIKVLESGSKGNSTLIISNYKKILIDIGITYNVLKSHLEEDGINITEIDALLITHVHNDHIKGLKQLLNKNKNLKVLIPSSMHEEIDYLNNEQVIYIDKNSSFYDIDIEIIKTSHDALYSYGYVLIIDNIKMVYITDTGYINKKYFDILTNCDVYIMESNYDEEMLMNGKYPHYLKQRVLSDSGHLSNISASTYISKFIGNRTKLIILAHLSENNNTEELALNTLIKKLENSNYRNKIMIAKQHESLEMVEII